MNDVPRARVWAVVLPLILFSAWGCDAEDERVGAGEGAGVGVEVVKEEEEQARLEAEVGAKPQAAEEEEVLPPPTLDAGMADFLERIPEPRPVPPPGPDYVPVTREEMGEGAMSK